MNHVYRLVWSHVLNAWVVACENARGRGKSSGRALTAAALSLAATLSQAGPLGGQVTAGSASIVQSGATTTVTQTTANASLSWQSFNTSASETVNFVQPSASAIAVNRIYDTAGTQFFGRLNANGQVYLINPNGVLFGQGAQVNVGGLVASTLGMSDASLAGNKRSFSGNGTGSVINRGSITAAEGGYVALLGNSVSNQGTISARLGTVALAGGSAATLTFNGNSLVQVQVDQSTLNNLAENRQLIVADGGQVLMTAGAKDSLLASVVNNTGVVQARTVENRGGTIVLLGGMAAGQTNVDGTLDASAPTGGNGGFIETSAAHVKVADSARVTTLAANGHSGTWLIDPVDFTIAASGGDMTGAAVGTALAGGNFTIQSTSGAAGTAGDVNVNDTVTWSANTLTLNARNNININAQMNGSGTAGLALEYGQGAVALNNTSTYNVRAPINLASTGSFSTKLGSDGAVKSYTIITSLGVEGDATVAPAIMTLQGMNKGLTGKYVLGADIDASATVGWNGSLGFAPIGDFGTKFTGTLDGLGHTINALTIARSGQDGVGLFGFVDSGGAIRNLGLVGGSTTGAQFVGGLVGYNQGTISNAYATGSISGNVMVGGLVGYSEGTISNAYATGSVSDTGNVTPYGHANFGGLVGENDGTISNAYATGSVSGASVVGGLVGNNYGGTISNAYATGSVSGAFDDGGLVGNNLGTISNGYWDTTTAGAAVAAGVGTGSSTGVTGLTTADLASTLPTGFSSATWGNGDNQTTPYLLSHASFAKTSGSVILASDASATPTAYSVILTATQLQNMNANLSGRYVLGANIDASATAGWNGGAGFAPVGDNGSGNAFTGTLDGLGHTISGLFINRTDTHYKGLFGVLGDASVGGGAVRNLGLVGVSITGDGYVGGLVGWAKYSTISNVYTTGSVKGSFNVGGLAGMEWNSTITNAYSTADVVGPVSGISGETSYGGLVGRQLNGTISNAYATGSVTGNYAVGGLVGESGGGTISNAYATGVVSGLRVVGGLVGSGSSSVAISNAYATGSVTGTDYVGGLLGSGSSGVAISNAYATGSVNGRDYVGGLVGSDWSGTISNAYTIGSITGTTNVGGLVGYTSGTVSNTYATGAVTGSANFGGLVGRLGGSGTVTTSFWDKTVNPNPLVDNGLGTGTTTADMKKLSTFASAGWVIDDVGGTGKIWRIYGGNTNPLLRSFMTTLNVQPAYDGSGTAMTNIGAYSIVGPYDPAQVLGTIPNSLTLSSSGVADNYTAALSPGLYSTQQGYDIVNTSRSIATPGSAIGDIALTNPITWTSGTLNLNAAGTITDTAAINGTDTAVFNLQGGTWRQVNASLPAFTAQDFRISGGTFVRALAGDGTVATPYQLADIYGVQGMGSLGMLAKNYVLANDVDASGTASWDAGAGFAAVGKFGIGEYFTGTLDGQGYTISGLFINRPGDIYQGLFGALGTPNAGGTGGAVRNLGLVGVSVTGKHTVGGLAGAAFNSTISNVYTTGVVGADMRIGGLVGWASASTITNAYSTAKVNGKVTTLSGWWYYGGLVGYNDSGTISNAYATGKVTGTTYVGGLVGENSGTISNAYATGFVSGYRLLGGLVGYHSGGSISNAYATGSVSATSVRVGGLVGYFGINSGSGTISNTYATGTVTGSANVGGLVGELYGSGATVTASFWDTQTTGQAGSAGGAGAVGMTTADMMAKANFTSATTANGNVNPGWAIDDVGGTGKVWRIYEGKTNPLLRSFLTPLTATADSQTVTYNGTTQSASNAYTVAAHDPSRPLDGTAVVTASGRNAGTYASNLTGLWSTQQGYDLIANSSVFTIAKANLTISTGNVSKTYDGTTTAAGSALVTGGTLFGDTISGGTFAFTDRNAGTGKTVTVAGVTVNDGNGGNNYAVTYADNTSSTIAQKSLTISGTTAANRTYDGTANATLTAGTLSGLVGSETVGVTAAGVFDSRNAGNRSATASYTLANGSNGGLAANYSLADTTGHSATIQQANLTISTGNVTRTYDGTTAAAGSAVATGGTQLFDTDTLSGGSFAFTGKDAGTGKTVTVAGVTVNDGNSGNNYNVTYVDNTSSTINKANLTISTGNVTKTYDGTTAAAGSALVTAGTLFGADAISGGSFAFTDNKAGSGKTVTVAGVSVSDGNSGNNYNVTYAANTNSTINKANLTISIGNVTKTYDGTTVANGSAVATGGTQLFGGDTLSGGNFAFLDADAGTGRIVTVAGVSVNDGNSGNNYNVTYADNTSSTIAQKALTISGTTAADKTYDGTATATMTAGALSGMVGSETVGVSATGVFDSKNAGSRSATASYTLADGGNGGMAVNYILADTTGHAATIQKAVLTISGTTAADKTYDGTATATMTAGALSGLVGNESLGVTATGVFDSRNAGNRSATASYTLADGAGALAANYSLAGTTGHAATIQQAALTISGITAADKTYDGTTSATANTAAAVLTGKVAGDDVTVSATGAFADRNVGTAKTVTLASTYGGVDVGNYSITGQASTAANITPATLTYAATPATFLVGQVPALLSGSVMGLVGGDTLAGVTSGTVTWSSPATAASGAGQYAISGGGLAATNYVLAQAPGNASALTLAQATAPARVLHVLSALQAASKQPPQGDIDPPLKTIVIAELGSGVPCEHDAAKRELSLNSRGNAVTVQVVSCGVRMPLDPAKNN
jgi:trimeric autotransporter adhesin